MIRLWLDRRAAHRLIRRLHEHNAEHAKSDEALLVEAALWTLCGDERMATILIEARRPGARPARG